MRSPGQITHQTRKKRGWIFILVAIILLGSGVGIALRDRYLPVWEMFTGHPEPFFASIAGESKLLVQADRIGAIAVDESSIYWTLRGIVGIPGSLLKMSKKDGEITELAAVLLEPYSLLVDDEAVYWVEGTWEPEASFRIKRIPKRGGDVNEVWQVRGSIMQLSTDEDHLYWKDGETGSILQMEKDGLAPKVMVSNLDDLNFYTLIGGRLYLGGGGGLRTVVQERGTPEDLITVTELAQQLNIGLRDERSFILVGPVIQEIGDEVIFTLYVDNYPGMISCTDQRTEIIGLPRGGGTPRRIATVNGSLTDALLVGSYLYLTGPCINGMTARIESGETIPIELGYGSSSLAADEEYLYWVDREGLKVIRRSGE